MKLKAIATALLAVLPFAASAENKTDTQAETAREWIKTVTERASVWQQHGTLKLPSGDIFIGDTSWSDDYHMQGAKAVPAKELDVWLHLSEGRKYVLSVWLEADGGVPVSISNDLGFGVDSAYFSLGDKTAGQALVDIGEQKIPDVTNSFEFFLPHIDKFGFTALWLDVPPTNIPVFSVETKQDGGLKAVWTNDANGDFSGILIDIRGRESDGLYIDTLLE
ncbi:MAG: hypothetical protein ACPGVN_09810 [Alphaproteobacteria bacterium]